MKVVYLLRRHRLMAPVFQTKFRQMFSDQYEVVQAFIDPEVANAEKRRREARNSRFKYSIGRVTL